jgi:hypothetical protein
VIWPLACFHHVNQAFHWSMQWWPRRDRDGQALYFIPLYIYLSRTLCYRLRPSTCNSPTPTIYILRCLEGFQETKAVIHLDGVPDFMGRPTMILKPETIVNRTRVVFKYKARTSPGGGSSKLNCRLTDLGLIENLPRGVPPTFRLQESEIVGQPSSKSRGVR